MKKTKINDVKSMLQLLGYSCNVKHWGNGFLFAVKGEWYGHECKETFKLAEILRAKGFDVSFPSIGAFYFIQGV